MSEWNREAHPRHSRRCPYYLDTYQIGVQALNAVGADALGPVLTIETPVGPVAEFELPVNAWRRGQIEEEVFAIARFFGCNIMGSNRAAANPWPQLLHKFS